MKRQRGRNRGGGGGSGGGGKPQPQNANRAFDSNGPEGVKVRGNAQHVFEKYQQLARDANASGDRVLGENYLQHAEHYFRLLRAMQPTRPASEILGRDHFSSGFDIDFEDEGVQAQAEAADEAAAEASEAGEAAGGEQPRWQGDRPRDDRQQRDDRPQARDRDDRPRDERPRDERPRDDRPRDDRPRDDRPRDDRPREPRGERFEGRRDDQPRDQNREGGGRRDRWRDRDDRAPRADRPEREPIAAVEPQAQPAVTAPERPSPVLRDSEGGESHAPAFLQNTAAPRPEAASDEEPARKPRRRRAPRSFDGGEGAPPASETEEA